MACREVFLHALRTSFTVCTPANKKFFADESAEVLYTVRIEFRVWDG